METDGIEEAIEGQLRVLVTAASQLGQRAAASLQEQKRKAQALDEQEAKELQSRITAEQRMAQLELTRTGRDDWWEQATPEDIAYTYQVAVAWKDHDPEAARAEHRMREQLLTRYGIDVDNTNADPAAVQQAIRAAQSTRADVLTPEEAQRLAKGETVRDRAEARVLVNAEAGQERDGANRARSDSNAIQYDPDKVRQLKNAAYAYDSPERREAAAAHLMDQGIDPHVVDGRMRADLSQAKPATEAVTAQPGRSPKARKGRSGAALTRDRDGLSR